MKRLIAIAILLVMPAVSMAQCPVTGENVCNCAETAQATIDNPELEILLPWENGPHLGYFVVEMRNIEYIPELATNPATQFAIGFDVLGDVLRPSEGHIHGWIFPLDRNGHLVRTDGPVPRPTSYVRFYGAGGAEYYGNKRRGFYVKSDRLKDLKPGRYRIFFQAQHHDHTALIQATAPSFPPIASRDFWVW